MAVWPSPRQISVLLLLELVARNPNLGIPALEDGLFAILLMFDDLYMFRYFCKGTGREKGREKGRGKHGVQSGKIIYVGGPLGVPEPLETW